MSRYPIGAVDKPYVRQTPGARNIFYASPSVVTKRSKQAIRDADVRRSGFLEKPLELNIRSISLVFRKRECKILINSFIIFINIVHA
jgi:hypothetical protein